MANREALERLKLATGQDSSIMVGLEEAQIHPGNEPEYLSQLGLEKKHLKRLEKLGIAFRAYSKNIWLAGETMPNGKVVEPGSSYRDRGSRVLWLLVRK